MSRDLVVLSHLRWTFVWQRPQQLVSRLSAGYERTWFVEEPVSVEGLEKPVVRTEHRDGVIRAWLEVPTDFRADGFDSPVCPLYADALEDAIGAVADRTVWLYTPMALPVARALDPALLVYDVMDDLASFKFAPAALVLHQRQALREADIVFTGGRSLHRSVLEHRGDAAHCFPSGVETEHYEPAIAQRRRRPEPSTRVAGYVGVIDERIDLDLVAGLAAELADWEIRMVGPVAKIDPDTLPKASNICYPGPCAYADLPSTMAEFDVALMPFALNEATRSISPTKTLEYLAAGLPVVSTRVPDVVADYTGVVDLRDDAYGFADACRNASAECAEARGDRVKPVLRRQHWDAIASRMAELIAAARRESSARESA